MVARANLNGSETGASTESGSVTGSIGDGGPDVMVAGHGDDKVLGSKGNDILKGGAGNDVINGGAGNDKLYGLGGDNRLIGGKGGDTLNFSADLGDDRIKGFHPGDDVIRFDKDLFADYAALKSAMSSHKGGVLIEAGDGSVFLDKIKIQKLDADDFLFA